MAGRISLIVIQGDKSYEISSLVSTVRWRGRKGSSARTLTATLIDDDGYKHARSGINVEEGHQCIFSWDGEELFRGIIMRSTQSNRKRMEITAYDNGIYLSNNKDTFCYENKTASDVFRDCCNRFGLPMGEVTECGYRIPELVKSKTTAWDAIADALSLDFNATGTRHYVSSKGGRLSLLTRRENILQWVVEVGQNLSEYTYNRSIEDTRTRVKLVSKEGTTVAEQRDTALEGKIGIMQEVQQPDESLTVAQAKDIISGILAEKSAPERSLELDAIGIPEVISGVGIYVVIPELEIQRTWYVDEDTHTFEGNNHTMTLRLNYASDLEAKSKSTAAAETGGGPYKVGDIVQFAGGSHYVSSTADKPASTKLRPGPAKITRTAKGAKHPWHLVTEDWAKTGVWGWVDDGSFQ